MAMEEKRESKRKGMAIYDFGFTIGFLRWSSRTERTSRGPYRDHTSRFTIHDFRLVQSMFEDVFVNSRRQIISIRLTRCDALANFGGGYILQQRIHKLDFLIDVGYALLQCRKLHCVAWTAHHAN